MAEAQERNFNATNKLTGKLNPIHDCWIKLGNTYISLYALPEISESKQATYSDQPIQGRAAPVKTYANSSNRTISAVLHLYTTCQEDVLRNLFIIRKISSLTHPEYNNTYLPPPTARFKCGRLLSEENLGVPVVLKSYNLSYDTRVQWFYYPLAKTYMPLHVSIQTDWDVIYSWTSLPGQADVLKGKY